MTTLLLSAGRATRLGDTAPFGCKALVEVGGRSMLQWWRRHDPDLVLVCRSEHLSTPTHGTRTVVHDGFGGPAAAVLAALPACDPDEPVTVAYADTWLPQGAVPDSPGPWCAVATAPGGRAWDIVDEQPGDRFVFYGHLDQDATATVCVGLYRFPDHDLLRESLELAVAAAEWFETDAGMADVVNFYTGCEMVGVTGWQDVGDVDALAAWKAP